MTLNKGQTDATTKLRQLATLIFNLRLPVPFETMGMANMRLCIANKTTLSVESDDGRAKENLPAGTYLIIQLTNHPLDEPSLQGLTLIVQTSSPPEIP